MKRSRLDERGCAHGPAARSERMLGTIDDPPDRPSDAEAEHAAPEFGLARRRVGGESVFAGGGSAPRAERALPSSSGSADVVDVDVRQLDESISSRDRARAPRSRAAAHMRLGLGHPVVRRLGPRYGSTAPSSRHRAREAHDRQPPLVAGRRAPDSARDTAPSPPPTGWEELVERPDGRRRAERLYQRTRAGGGSPCASCHEITGLRRTPMRSISASITSPGLR